MIAYHQFDDFVQILQIRAFGILVLGNYDGGNISKDIEEEKSRKKRSIKRIEERKLPGY